MKQPMGQFRLPRHQFQPQQFGLGCQGLPQHRGKGSNLIPHLREGNLAFPVRREKQFHLGRRSA